MTNSEGSKDQQYDTGCQIGKRALQGQTHSKAGGPTIVTRLVVWMPNSDSTASTVTVNIK